MNMLLPAELQPFRLTIADYELLGRAKVFADRRVELIEGVIVEVNAEMRPHVLVKNRLSHRLQSVLETLSVGLEAVVEPTLALPPHNMPEPDLLIVRTDATGSYFTLQDTALVIEVGASSLRGDLSIKKQMYAEQGLPEYWVIDVARRQVHQFWGAGPEGFAGERVIPLDGELRSATIAGLVIDGNGIL